MATVRGSNVGVVEDDGLSVTERGDVVAMVLVWMLPFPHNSSIPCFFVDFVTQGERRLSWGGGVAQTRSCVCSPLSTVCFPQQWCTDERKQQQNLWFSPCTVSQDRFWMPEVGGNHYIVQGHGKMEGR